MEPIINKPYISQSSINKQSKNPLLAKTNISTALIKLTSPSHIERKELEISKLLSSEDLSPLKTELGKIESLLVEAKSFDSNKAVITQGVLQQMAEKWSEEIISLGNVNGGNDPGKDFSLLLIPVSEDEGEDLKSDLETASNVDDSINLAKQLNAFLKGEGVFQHKAADKTDISKVDFLTRNTAMITSIMLLDKIKELIISKEDSLKNLKGNEKAVLENEIALLKKWTAVQSSLLNDLLKENAVMSVLSLPEVAATIVGLANAANHISAGIFSWISLGVTLIPLAINWRKANTNLNKHKVWTEVIKNGGTTVHDAKKIVDRQEEIFNKRFEISKIEFNSIVSFFKMAEKLSEKGQEQAIKQVIDRLKEIGITISLEDPTLKDLHTILSNPQEKEQFKEMMIAKIQTKEALSVSVRNSLKTLANKKNKIDREFLKMALHKAKGIFTATALLTALGIAIKVLMLTGVIASAAALAATGIGVIVATSVITIAGTIYFYIKKPNVFKTYLNGLQFKLLFWRLPLAIQNYKRNYKLLQASKISEEIHALACRVLEVETLIKENKTEDIHLYLKKYALVQKKSVKKGDLKQILGDYKTSLIKKEAVLISHAEKLESLNHSVERFEEKVKVLQDEVDKAGWKDFQQQLQKEKKSKIKEVKKDEADILAEYLLKDAKLLDDSETKKILNHLNINLEKVKGKSDIKFVKKETAKVIRSFFAMEESATINLIDQQNLMETHGLH